MIASSLLAWCLDLVFPKYCAGCRTEGPFLCAPCAGRLIPAPPSCPVCQRRNLSAILCGSCEAKSGLRRFYAPFSYRDPLIRELIHIFKYGGVRELAQPLGSAVAGALERHALRPRGPALLVPIPLHRTRLRSRGFNQAVLLARELGSRLQLPVAEALDRRRAARPQVEMPDHASRRANVEGAFRISDAASVAGRTAILIDDVSTSGATLGEAARVLRAAGCRTVWAVVIAKG
jgi:ComF family protein